MTEGSANGRHDVIVVGGGQAGLAIGYFLARQGRDFTILEAAAEPARGVARALGLAQAVHARPATTPCRGSPSRATPTATRAGTRSSTT